MTQFAICTARKLSSPLPSQLRMIKDVIIRDSNSLPTAQGLPCRVQPRVTLGGPSWLP
jgi:hypothetical protein